MIIMASSIARGRDTHDNDEGGRVAQDGGLGCHNPANRIDRDM